MIAFKLPKMERRALAMVIVERLVTLTPSPQDLAALAATVNELVRESCAHTIEQSRRGTRAELFAAVDAVAAEERAVATETTAVRDKQIARERS